MYYTPAIGWGILILYFSLLPGPQVPPVFKSVEDFFLHFFIYFMFTILIGLAKSQFKRSLFSINFMLGIILFSILFGGAIELIQGNFIPHRMAGWDDFFANSFGAVIGALIVKVWTSR